MPFQLRDDGMPSHSRLAYDCPKPMAAHGQRPTGYCRGLTSEAGRISSPTQPLPTQVDARTDYTAPQEAGNDPDNDMDRTVASMDNVTESAAWTWGRYPIQEFSSCAAWVAGNACSGSNDDDNEDDNAQKI